MYESILLPTDGSEGAATAARHAARLGAAFESRVHVLSVVDERQFGDVVTADSTIEDRRAAAEEEATEAVEAIEAVFDAATVPCRTSIEEGVPHVTIVEYAADHDLDLITMGTRGRTGLDRVLIGSVAERVVRRADVPVVTTRAAPSDADYERILVPTDGSEAAATAVDHALAIADRFDATVYALSVVDLDALAAATEMGAGISAVVEALEADCERAVETVAERCAERDLDAVTEVRRGSPARAIDDYVDASGIDLVTMGTSGRTGLERYLLGSVAERVVRTSDVPVLTAR